MAETNREQLRNWFSTEKIPTQTHFHELINNSLNQADDGIERGGMENPLKITAAYSNGGPQIVFQFHKLQANGEKEASPNWEIHLASKENPPDDLLFQGLNIVNSNTGNSNLFIEEETGNIGIGTIQPKFKLHLEAKDMFIKHPEKNSGVYIGAGDDGSVYINNVNNYADNGTDNNNSMYLATHNTLWLKVGESPSGSQIRLSKDQLWFGVGIGMNITEDSVSIGVPSPKGTLHISGDKQIYVNTMSGSFIIGSTNGQHIAMDNQDIMSKSNSKTPSPLVIQRNGGDTIIVGNLVLGMDDKFILNPASEEGATGEALHITFETNGKWESDKGFRLRRNGRFEVLGDLHTIAPNGETAYIIINEEANDQKAKKKLDEIGNNKLIIGGLQNGKACFYWKNATDNKYYKALLSGTSFS